MKRLEIYEPPLCCPTGVCGPAPDPALAELQENILRGSRDVVQQIFGFFVTGAKGSGEGPTGCCSPGRGGCCE